MWWIPAAGSKTLRAASRPSFSRPPYARQNGWSSRRHAFLRSLSASPAARCRSGTAGRFAHAGRDSGGAHRGPALEAARLGMMPKRPLADSVVLATTRYHGAEVCGHRMRILRVCLAFIAGKRPGAKRRQGPRDARPRKAVREQPIEALNVGVQDAACGISHGNQHAADRPAGLKGTRGIHRETSSGTAVPGGWVDASDFPCYGKKRPRALLFAGQNMFVVDKDRTSRSGRGDVMARF